MVDLQVLEVFDALIWLRSADQVASRYAISPATTSRCRRRCLDLFGLEMERRDGEWHLIGDTSLLLLERQVHQEARWRGLRPLRLEATYWSAPLLASPPLPGWILGVSNIVGVGRLFQLLRECVIDAVITGLPDVPGADDPELITIPLIRMPVFFVVGADHPLLRQPSLSVEAIAAYPSLALPQGCYPRVEAALRALGLWNDGVRMGRYRREQWEGRAEQELVVGYGTPLSLEVSGENLRRLPLNLPFSSGDALVLRRKFGQQLRLQELLQLLHHCYRPVVERQAEVEFDPALLARLPA